MRVVATAGHVDHGKTTLLRALTGMEPDRWEEERQRGLTIDLGYVWTRMDIPGAGAEDVAFVDVPGHQGFITNMLAGMAVVDDALLVVAADDGWAQQSQEHLDIIRLLGIRVLVAIVTRVDLVEDSRVEAVQDQVRERLAAAGIQDVPVVPVAAPTGTGVDAVREALAQRIADGPPAADHRHAPARLHIDRAFSPQGVGTVVTGMLKRGTLRVGDEAMLVPSGLSTRIRGLQQLGGPVDEARSDSRVAVQLGRIPLEDVGRGMALIGAGARSPSDGTRMLDVALQTLDETPVGRAGAWHVHLGTTFASARIVPLVGDIGPRQRGPVRLVLDRDVVAWTDDPLVLRESGRGTTVAGGRVLDPAPLELPRSAEARLEHALVLEEIDRASTDAARVRALVAAHRGVREQQDVVRALGRDIDAPIDELLVLGESLVEADLAETWIRSAVDAAERAPAEEGVERSEVVAHVRSTGCSESLARAAVDIAHRRGALHAFGTRSVHADHESSYVAARRSREQAFLETLARDPLEPPDPETIIASSGVIPGEVQGLIDSGRIVGCGPLLFTAEAIDLAIAILREEPSIDDRSFTASQARSAWGTTRRCAVPLLEHLRTTGVTRFDGESHSLVD